MNALVVMAIGEKHLRLFEASRKQFERYAQRTGAELLLCKKPPDPTFARSLLAQKLLLPELCMQHEWMAFIDLDIVISDEAPSIFDFAHDDRAFGAVLDPRDTVGFKNVVTRLWGLPELLQETHRSYFIDRGYPAHPSLVGSINGGVFLCRPSKIATILRGAYHSDFRESSQGGAMIKRKPETYEEGMMAYLSQANDLFFPLDDRFNTQFVFRLFANLEREVYPAVKSKDFRKLHEQNAAGRFPDSPADYPPAYRSFVREALENCFFLHFSAGFPFVNLGLSA